MANPEHVETLDILDKTGVVMYRTGISIFAISLFAFSIELFGQAGLFPVPEVLGHLILSGLALGVALSAGNIHVYSKPVRYAISWPGWVGLIILFVDIHQTVVWLALGFFFITFSGIALKESFCFKVIGLKLVPLFLASSVFLMFFKFLWITGLLLLLASGILAYLSKAKWQMPLHFDIGDKSRYQV
ncbi:DUF2301 domain-containing membrane protein [Vibrio salinus]|uniref:DUF2301 domain-containing membrane protein n=1 Tax=Vibrio salinus TaxID=2899784 RepID=UPI001E4E1E71|nr:DUF2301 domain-containing membrane protein [Vibrio salinus]MCE0495965.1 DUF2301 domain-containing membrane protein [Vibrio salinus]